MQQYSSDLAIFRDVFFLFILSFLSFFLSYINTHNLKRIKCHSLTTKILDTLSLSLSLQQKY